MDAVDAPDLTRPLDTPLALFVFNRPHLVRPVWSAVRAARPRTLLIVADGPRADRLEDASACAAARAVVETIDWPCVVHRNYARNNLGLKGRVETGLAWVFDLVDEAIVLEDDCVPGPSFFPFCEAMLARYRSDDRVRCISGNNFCAEGTPPRCSYHFSRFPHIWGWASWRRAWRYYDPEMRQWPQWRDTGALRSLLGDRTAADYWTYVLQKNYERESSWDYLWLFACWASGGLSITPAVNLVSNIGFGPEGTHTTDARSPFARMASHALAFPFVHPSAVERDAAADVLVEDVLFSGGLRRVFLRIRFQPAGGVRPWPARWSPMPPAVSVIIAVKNGARFLAQALDSVAAQTLPAAEVIVVDGHSTDGTARIAAARSFVRLVSQRGTGFADAWNQGLETTAGRLIAFLDSDDLWPPYKLERQVECLAAHPEIDYTIGRVRFFLEPGVAVPASFRSALLNGDHTGYIPGNVVARRELFDRIGTFNTEWAISSDVEWFFRGKDAGVRHLVLPDVLLMKRVHQLNLSLAGPGASLFQREIVKICGQSIRRQRIPREHSST